jgi:hypothetical protein
MGRWICLSLSSLILPRRAPHSSLSLYRPEDGVDGTVDLSLPLISHPPRRAPHSSLSLYRPEDGVDGTVDLSLPLLSHPPQDHHTHPCHLYRLEDGVDGTVDLSLPLLSHPSHFLAHPSQQRFNTHSLLSGNLDKLN